MDELEKITQLTELGRKAELAYKEPASDSIAGLTRQKIEAWSKLLSSVASAEATEEDLIQPLEHLPFITENVRAYLKMHAKDEDRHARALKNYIKATFDYEKKKKTLTDKVIYDGVFKQLKNLARRKPLPFLAVLWFYEAYSGPFYEMLLHAARRDGLTALAELIEEIERDELRHRAGLKLLLSLWKSQNYKADAFDYWLTKALIGVVKADVNTAPAAVYNRHVRRHLFELGIEPAELVKNAKLFGDKTLKIIGDLR